jgi:hypothetical protein
MAIYSKSKIKDKYVWACSARPRHEISIRNNSVFEGLKSSMLSIIKNICFWSTNTLKNTVSQEIRLDHNTISAWSLNLREFIQDCFLEDSILLGGYDESGNNKIVEIYESLFFRRKYNMERYRGLNGVST